MKFVIQAWRRSKSLGQVIAISATCVGACTSNEMHQSPVCVLVMQSANSFPSQLKLEGNAVWIPGRVYLLTEGDCPVRKLIKLSWEDASSTEALRFEEALVDQFAASTDEITYGLSATFVIEPTRAEGGVIGATVTSATGIHAFGMPRRVMQEFNPYLRLESELGVPESTPE